MTKPKSIPIYALVESFEHEMCGVHLFPPLSIKVVAPSWGAASKLLKSRWQKQLKKLPPSDWLRGRPRSIPSHKRLKFSMKPPRSDVSWTEPLPIEIDLFCWAIAETHFQWHCPSLQANFLTDHADVSDALLEKEVMGALVRSFENPSLSDILETLVGRRFEVKQWMDLSIQELSELYNAKREQKKKPKLAALRSVAMPVAKWPETNLVEYTEYLKRLDDLLLSEKPASVLLVGPPGVGKSAIVYEWAKRLSGSAQSDGNRVRTVWATSGARLVSGASGLGMWQQRCHRVVEEARDAGIVLHLGNAIELIESGKIHGQPGVASQLRTSIDRNQLIAIVECTAEQLSVIEREEPLLLRSFVRVDVTAPDAVLSSIILGKTAERLEKQYHVRWLETATDEMVRLHTRFSTYSAMPGQPLNMLRSMMETWVKTVPIDRDHVSERFAQDTGLPEFLLNESIPLDSEKIRQQLSSEVIGQPEPIDRIVRLMSILKARMNRTDRPLASLLLIGPTGVGKTETAKALARLLYRDPQRMIRIDMSEYAHSWSGARMLGAANAGDGTLTSPIRDQPFSVVLLDEFEKCHPSVLDLLLQVLGEGRLTDSMGRVADFRNAVILLTSNLGVESYHGQSMGFDNHLVKASEHFLREIQRFVRPEFLGRIDQIIPYQPLSLDVVRQIADREILQLKGRSGLRYRSIPWSVTESARDRLARSGYDPAMGARPLRRELERQVAIPLANALCSANSVSVPDVTIDTDSKTNQIVAQQVMVRRQSVVDYKERDVALEAVRDLVFRARLLRFSSKFYRLQNDQERRNRQLLRLRRKLKEKVTTKRRRQGLRYQVEMLQGQFNESQKFIQAFLDLVGQIEQLNLDTQACHLRSDAMDVHGVHNSTHSLMSDLKRFLVLMQSTEPKAKELCSLIVLCDSIDVCKPLWQAYKRLAEWNDWRVIPFRLMAYNPLNDPLSPEFLAKQSAARKKLEIPDHLSPAFRLLQEHHRAMSEDDILKSREGTAADFSRRDKAIDVYRIGSWKELEALPTGTLGVAFQIDNGAISTWLGEEHGVHHFLKSSQEERRRVRARVLLHPGRLIDWDPPMGWRETPSLPARDPRRVHVAADDRLISCLIPYEVSTQHLDPIAAWVDMIQQESDTRLWQSVGYHPIPTKVKFGYPLYEISIIN